MASVSALPHAMMARHNACHARCYRERMEAVKMHPSISYQVSRLGWGQKAHVQPLKRLLSQRTLSLRRRTHFASARVSAVKLLNQGFHAHDQIWLPLNDKAVRSWVSSNSPFLVEVFE